MAGSIENFRDDWLQSFFVYGTPHKCIPANIESALARKLDIINAAKNYQDLRAPPGNRLEMLQPPLQRYSSIRVNGQYRLIFQWDEGKARHLYLDPHRYKYHR
ncbi:type II toxin-antitoxin system RelE/ParE family toxin [Pantoea sp. At-9b]|jgi:toxin HigB-1|uniref:type II toxin-antitoxin system RelE/ParE family toxin n=1 Tax=Pantoea sp. (strain At-9b) TaxID=592316 RepID=UPI0001B3DF4B|nr:type II toxin-antitoxin system RelE/ParE family toxin [Pantoea sp. At-9b]ADU71076.1 plasmid maintenance system killer [Pantoea sp. At-9b]